MMNLYVIASVLCEAIPRFKEEIASTEERRLAMTSRPDERFDFFQDGL